VSARLSFFAAVLGAWLLAIVVRLYGLQVIERQHYVKLASDQQQRVVTLAAPRGTIRDARGRELATSVEVESVAVDPRKVEDPEHTAAVLGEALGWSSRQRAELVARLTANADRHFIWVARKIDPERLQAVEDQRDTLPGVNLLPESRRFYPLGELAAPVLGYAGMDNIGLAGLELFYDKIIAGRPGRRVVIQDGTTTKVTHPGLEASAARAGADLRLTLDAALQYRVERELETAVRRSNAASGTVVVLAPQSGAVLAMASYPSFDPNRLSDYSRSELENRGRNRAVADAYEPGSTFKAITLAAALEQGAVSLDDEIDCEIGALELNGVRIRDHRPFGILSVRQVIARSSNVGAMKLGLAAGRKALYDTIRAFGFGRPTGIDLPAESAGLLRPLERWSALTPAYVSFGQGISTTALQMATAFAAIANGGRLLQPYVVAAIGDREVGPEARRRPSTPVSPATVRQLRAALESVVLEGTGTPAAVAGYRVAGKTGTAEKVIGGRYAEGHYVASFVGFVPAGEPQLVIAVVIDEPWPAYHGSEAAAPVFRAIAQQALLHLGIRPLREPHRAWPGERPPSGPLPDDRPAARRQVSLARAGPPAPVPVPAGTVPDFTGLSKRRAVAVASRLGLRLELHGSGFVRRQQPSAATPLELAGSTLELWLTPSLASDGEGP